MLKKFLQKVTMSNRSSETSLKIVDDGLETDHFITVCVPTTPQPDTVFETKVNNQDLAELLQIIYTKKLHFPNNHREVKFIKNAVESFVLNIVTDIIDNRKGIFNDGVESFDDAGRLESNDESVVCKIGSFYEQTKNTYPDQFDFVFVPFSIHLTDNQTCDSCTALRLNVGRIKDRVDVLFRRGCMVKKDEDVGVIELESFMQETRDILTLRFCLTRNLKQPNNFLEVFKVIKINLVPGIRMVDPNLMENVRSHCSIRGFQEHILATSSLQYLRLPYSDATFCEAEVIFFHRELSSNHVKVYRLLKYLINGEGDDEELLNECLNTGDQTYFHIPSYAIKTAIIIHHYECADDNNIGQCILGVLRWFQTKFAEPSMTVVETHDDMNSMPICHLEMNSLTNKQITMATGNPRLVSEASGCLDTMISDLRGYRKKPHGHDSGVKSFAARMTDCVKKYDLDKRPLVRAIRHGQRAIKESGSCCYRLVILLSVVAFCVGLLFVFALT